MTLDEIVQTIYAERYQDPKHAELATYMRDVMIRQVVERALELSIGSLAIDLAAARHARNTAYRTVTSWLEAAKARGDLKPDLEPGPGMAGWRAYERADETWRAVLAKLDAWLADNEKG